MNAAIILAAGNSRRMGSPKALLPFRNTSFIDHILQQVQKEGCRPIVPVLGKMAEAILKNSAVHRFPYIINPAPDQGMLSSIKMGLGVLPPDAEGFLLILVDHPLVRQSTYHALLKAARVHPGYIIIPQFKQKHGHPVYFHRFFFKELLETPAAQSARTAVQNNKNRVYYLSVDDAGILKDIDTPQDFKKYGKSLVAG